MFLERMIDCHNSWEQSDRRHPDFDLAQRLIDMWGENVNAQTHSGSTALMFARTPEMINFLLENGADVNLSNKQRIDSLDECGQIRLFRASSKP